MESATPKSPKAAVNCTKTDPTRMLIPGGEKAWGPGEIAGVTRNGLALELRPVILQERQEVSGTARTMGVSKFANCWRLTKMLKTISEVLRKRRTAEDCAILNMAFLIPPTGDFREFNLLTMVVFQGRGRKHSNFYRFTQAPLPNEPTARAFRTSDSRESAKMLGVNLWSDLGSHSIQSHLPSL